MSKNYSKKGNMVVILIIVASLLVLLGLFLLTIANVNKNKVFDFDETLDIKPKLSEKEALEIGEKLYGTVNHIFELNVLTPYCGIYGLEKEQKKMTNFGIISDMGPISFYDSGLTSLVELKNLLRENLAEELVDKIVVDSPVTDVSLLKDDIYRDYVEKDGHLYCRNQASKDWNSLYLHDFSISVLEILEDKITYQIRSIYATEDNDDKCFEELTTKACKNGTYKDTKFVIVRNDSGDWVASEYTLHD